LRAACRSGLADFTATPIGRERFFKLLIRKEKIRRLIALIFTGKWPALFALRRPVE
jgi:hypothetical protein